MNVISILILFPLLMSIMIYLTKNDTIRNLIVRAGSCITAILTVVVVVRYFEDGLYVSIKNEQVIDTVIMIAEIIVATYIILTGLKNKQYLVTLFSAIQTPVILWFELTQKKSIEVSTSLILDKLSLIMVLIIGIIGSLICLYSVGYMKWYHIHHHYEERKPFFMAVLFLFLSAMFGLVLSNNLTWIYFCWEITSLCSFLLIGYTKTPEAKKNSFLALKINLGGGLAFAVAIVYIGMKYSILELSAFIKMNPDVAVYIPVFLLCIAALTKSAQIPFSSWLLGAMVAPTPSSALLHSATMVKAGVYLLIRLAPLLGDNIVGRSVTLIGALTFLMSAVLAISQSDGKKILAYSTISNLGLIVMCASVGNRESIWAAILLIIFHAISKSLLFLSVGSIEHQIGSRDVENMDILSNVSKKLCIFLLIGIAGMFLAPFGMLLSKWIAMKAFIDSGNIITFIILAYGSAATLFYWAKWMGKLVSTVDNETNQVFYTPIAKQNSDQKVEQAQVINEGVSEKKEKHKFHKDEEIPITLQALLVVLCCFAYPVISKYALIPYLKDVFGMDAVIPLHTSDIQIMFLMIAMLILLPISFIPLHKKDKRRIVPIYMAGVNAGDNKEFYGAALNKRKLELSNWYMQDFFNNKKISFWSDIISIAIISVCIIYLIGGMVI